MDKMLTVNQKRATKHPKIVKKKSKQPPPQQPLKVVYITNPIKFKATASEFMSLVQELTGQDAELPESSRIPTNEGGGGATVKSVAADDSIPHASDQDCGSPNGNTGSDPFMGFGSYGGDGVFYAPQSTAEGFPEMVAESWHGADYDHVDWLKSLDAM